MTRRRGRSLSSDEVSIWRHVARSIKPLPGHDLPPEPQLVSKPETIAKPQTPAAPPPEKAKAKQPVPPPLVSVERRQMRDLRRGVEGIDARIDLHGMRQSEAHFALFGFLHRAQSNGARMVLVVTGKGNTSSASDPEAAAAFGVNLMHKQKDRAKSRRSPPAFYSSAFDPFHERGILRRLVPQWLSLPEMRSVVLGYSVANREHGGEGALYVRIRRIGRSGAR